MDWPTFTLDYTSKKTGRGFVGATVRNLSDWQKVLYFCFRDDADVRKARVIAVQREVLWPFFSDSGPMFEKTLGEFLQENGVYDEAFDSAYIAHFGENWK